MAQGACAGDALRNRIIGEILGLSLVSLQQQRQGRGGRSDSNQDKRRSSHAYIDAHASLRQLSDRGVTFPNLGCEFSGLPGV